MESLLVEDQAVLIRGDVRLDENGPLKISVSEIIPLEVARVRLPAKISITLRLDNGGCGETAEKLRELFDSKPGETHVRLRLLRKKDFLVFYELADNVNADRGFRAEVEQICGAGSLEIMPS